VQLSHPGPRIWTHHRNVVGRTYRVVAVRCKQPLSTKGSVVLAAGRYSVPGAALRRLRLGQYVKLTWTVGWRDMLDTVGGDPLLVTRGVAVAPASCPSYFCDRNPRTGVGFTPAGHALLVVVDGRRDGWSDGMTLLEFANLFVYLGATRALNLDGGGSSTMVVGGRVVNRPSDGQERWVSSAVLVMPGQGSGSRTRIAARTLEPAPEAPRRSIDAALVDPGSTGGMLDAIQDGAFGPPPRMTTQEGAALRAYRNAARRGGAP
jgi:hypothetical protein